MRIVGQVPARSKGRSDWHVAGSEDGRWAASDDFQYEVWLYDRHSGEVNLLAGPQKTGADHIHPDLQPRRHQDRDPIGAHFEGQPLAEYLHRPGAQDVLESDLFK